MSKRIEILGKAGNERTVEIVISGESTVHDRGNIELTREAARTLYYLLPARDWAFFVEAVNQLDAIQ